MKMVAVCAVISRKIFRHQLFLGLVHIVFIAGGFSAQFAQAADANRGAIVSETERCQGCHGETGISATSVIPNLASQQPNYIVKQLKDFKSGRRKHPIMSIMAADVVDEDAVDIAAYFASMPAAKGVMIPTDAKIKELFISGDSRRNLRSCTSCHGPDGRGRLENGIAYPAIGGQQTKYLRAQLVSWMLNERNNSPEGMMGGIAKKLSLTEIDALSIYISGL